MERNTQAKISELKIGDRFYKIGDKNKTVFSKVDAAPVITNYQTYKHHGLKDGDKTPVHFKSDTAVIFLRHQ